MHNLKQSIPHSIHLINMTLRNLTGKFLKYYAHSDDVLGATLLNDLQIVEHSRKDDGR